MAAAGFLLAMAQIHAACAENRPAASTVSTSANLADRNL